MKFRYEDLALENIRPALELCRRLHEESPLAEFQFDEEWAAQRLYQGIITNEHAIGEIAFEGDEPVGLITIQLMNHDFAPSLLAFNNIWYVAKRHRGSMVAVRLLKSMQDWAEERGAITMHIGVAAGINSKRTGKLLNKLGYKFVGGNHLLYLGGHERDDTQSGGGS